MTKILLIDGYVDEPSCLGVPPYISPYVRYTYGALLELGFKEEYIEYRLVDEARGNWQEFIEICISFDYLVIIAGTTVPGKYMGGKPISIKEIKQLAEWINDRTKKTKLLLGGPILLTAGKKVAEGVDVALDETGALGTYEYFSSNGLGGINNKSIIELTSQENKGEKINLWAKLGAKLTRRHPNFPHLVCEIETYRGCLRASNCKFCSEFLKNVIYTRPQEEVAGEVESLYLEGNKYFRLGAQTDLFMYGAEYKNSFGIKLTGDNSWNESKGINDSLRPNPQVIKELYSKIRDKAPGLSVLHMDNANPTTIARFQEDSSEIIKTIVEFNTPGDTAAFGLESADKRVLEANNIGTNPEETLKAIKIMNEYGRIRKGGVPKLLPGLNFLHGLEGEDEKTYEKNLEFLKKILDEGYLLRRINVRQVIPLPGSKVKKLNTYKFNKYKERVNREINKPMLERVFPRGIILRDVLVEKVEGNISYGRQLGTYPILIGIPGKYQHLQGEFLDVRIVDHGYRSITGIKYPFNINEASVEEIQALPGIGKKRATRLFLQKPFSDFASVIKALDDSLKESELEVLKKYLDEFI